MIGLARVLCSKAAVYILDSPFTGLTKACQAKVERILRARQRQGVLIIIALKKAEDMNPNDLIIILNVAMTKEVGRYKDLESNPKSMIDNFIKIHKVDEF